MAGLDEHRSSIDAIDAELQRLIAQRARHAAAIGAAKRESGETDGYRPGREAQVMRAAIERNEGPLRDAQVARIMKEIMSACLHLESPLTVSYLGPAGTFTEAAMVLFFGHGVTPMPLPGIGGIFRAVEAREAEYGVVPIENSTEGVVTHTLDALARTDLRICGEVTMPVHHHLLAGNGLRLDDVKVVRAHPQALGQCSEWLEEHLPHADRQEASSNAEAARVASQEGGAAIASRVAADLYDLHVLAARIEDDPRNTTRFLVVGDQDAEPTGSDKTTFMVGLQDRPGALVDLLGHVAAGGVSMNRIESRPSRREPWDYHFFIDIDGHQADAPVAGLMERLRGEAAFVKVLGSYPKAVL